MKSPLLADLLLRAAARGLVSDEDGRRVAEYVEGLERVVAVASEEAPDFTDVAAALRALPEPPGGEGR